MARKTSPRLESLERRELLAASITHFDYTTSSGSHVSIRLYGQGSLAGTKVDAGGALDLEFSNTTSATGIVGRVSGGNGLAPLYRVRTTGISAQDISNPRAKPLSILNLKNFNLIAGGNINLTGGIGSLFLNSARTNSEIHLKALPTSTSSSSSTTTSTAITLTSASTVSIAGFSVSTVRATATTTTNTGTASSTPGVVEAFGQTATGINVVIHHIIASASQFPAVGDPQVYGYDPVANALIRFDATTGAPLQSIPLSTPASTLTGIGLTRLNSSQVVVVGNGQEVQVFQASTGASIGSFSIANLAAAGFTMVDGVSGGDTVLYLIDTTDGSTGAVQEVNLASSLASGSAVTIGTAFQPTQQFFLSGGGTYLPGIPDQYLGGSAFLDVYQPNLYQNGVLAATASKGSLTEAARGELPGPSSIQNAGNPPTMTLSSLGGINQNLAIITSVSNGKNVVSLYNPDTLAQNGTVTLNDPNRLTDLTPSFHPELTGVALVDVQGNLRSFRAIDAKGLVINESGFLNLVQIGNATDTQVIGRPIGHANIPIRKNVLLLSSGRSVGYRSGVVAIPSLQPVGPLSLPDNGA